VVIAANDGSAVDTQTLAVTVANVNEPPAITSNGGGDSASVSVRENTTAVTTVTATDPPRKHDVIHLHFMLDRELTFMTGR
jgi:hypothetical protein